MKPPDPSFLDALTRAESVLLTGHESPDGDCLGAEVALYHLLRHLGRKVRICNPDSPSRLYEFLSVHTPIEAFDPSVPLEGHDAVVLLDCAELARLGRMRQHVDRLEPMVLVIDHHVGSEYGSGDHYYVDSTAPATGLLVHNLFEYLGVPVPKPAAEGVLLSLVSDTGWFRYSNTTPEVLALAARLLESGIDASQLYDRLYRRNHPDSIEFLADALRRCRLALDGRFGFIIIDRATAERAARLGFDLDHVMEPLRSVADTEVVAMLRESIDGRLRVSFRASGEVDVQSIAKHFGGGGHRKAAGASVRGATEEVYRRIEEQVELALDTLDAGGCR